MDDLLVVGGGINGLSTAWAAAKRGERVALADPLPLLNEHNASNDESKIFRLAYGRDEELTRFAQRALALWRELEAVSGRTILHQNGLLMFPGAFARDSLETMRALGLPVEEVEKDPRELRGVAGGAFDPQAGWLDPTQALEALDEACRALGVRMLRGTRIDRVDRSLAKRVVLATGFHAPELVPDLMSRIVVTRQPELFFQAPPDYRAHATFAALDAGYYGFSARGGTVKVADHRRGPIVRDFAERSPPSQDELDDAREFLALHVPRIADAPLVRWRVCLYDNAPDDRFIVEKRDDFVVATGMSGHSFKFGPAMGEKLATL